MSLPDRTDRRDGLILAAAVSNITFDFIDGVDGNDIAAAALPSGVRGNLSPSTVGSWRAHINALANVVKNNYTSALIVEDDVDWDVRLKSLLKEFAVSNNVLEKHTGTFEFPDLPATLPPQHSPYGNDWDLLWLGHCGMNIPGDNIVIRQNDPTVPEKQYLHSWDMEEPTPLGIFPHHTRVVMAQVGEPVCSLGYAISQKGARSILYNLGLRALDAPFDVSLRYWCQGNKGNEQHNCPGVIPQLFDHYRRKGPKSRDSDINAKGSAVREKPETLNIRWSVRLNMVKLLRGDTSYDEQYPDTQ